MRRELLRVHPEMTEVELDEYESLTAQRFTLDPSRSGAAIAELDAARALLLAKMPHFAAVQRAFIEERRHATDRERATPEVRIRIESEGENTAGR